MSLYAVELKITGTFSTYIEAESKADAEIEVKRRASMMQPDSVVFESIAYQRAHCDRCGEDHFGPACQSNTIRPSWERERL